jgi:hypothetical protein
MFGRTEHGIVFHYPHWQRLQTLEDLALYRHLINRQPLVDNQLQFNVLSLVQELMITHGQSFCRDVAQGLIWIKGGQELCIMFDRPEPFIEATPWRDAGSPNPLPAGTAVWHGTVPQALPDIIRHGLHPSLEGAGSLTPVVYFTPIKATAIWSYTWPFRVLGKDIRIILYAETTGVLHSSEGKLHKLDIKPKEGGTKAMATNVQQPLDPGGYRLIGLTFVCVSGIPLPSQGLPFGLGNPVEARGIDGSKLTPKQRREDERRRRQAAPFIRTGLTPPMPYVPPMRTSTHPIYQDGDLPLEESDRLKARRRRREARQRTHRHTIRLGGHQSSSSDSEHSV